MVYLDNSVGTVLKQFLEEEILIFLLLCRLYRPYYATLFTSISVLSSSHVL
jgi:hypothetical protein